MPRKTREEALQTKQKLIDSALEVMCERPYASISITEIAERIGYSKGAIYWHFMSKNALLIQVVENACIQFGEELAFNCGEDQHPYDAIRAYFKQKLSKPFENVRFKRLQNLLARRPEWPEEVQVQVLSIFKKRITLERENVERMITEGQQEGALRKDISAGEFATLISVIFHGMFIFGITDLYDQTLDFAKYTDFVFDAFYKELKA